MVGGWSSPDTEVSSYRWVGPEIDPHAELGSGVWTPSGEHCPWGPSGVEHGENPPFSSWGPSVSWAARENRAKGTGRSSGPESGWVSLARMLNQLETPSLLSHCLAPFPLRVPSGMERGTEAFHREEQLRKSDQWADCGPGVRWPGVTWPHHLQQDWPQASHMTSPSDLRFPSVSGIAEKPEWVSMCQRCAVSCHVNVPLGQCLPHPL